MQEQQRRLRPPLSELLTPEQARDVQRGTTEEKLAVLNDLSREKRTLVFRMIPPQTVPDAFRREALAASQPRQAVVAELVEAKLQRAIYSPRQLEEVLVDFWLNHFNVFVNKGPVAHAAHELRARRDSPVRARPVPRHADGDGAASGDALLPRQLHVAIGARQRARQCPVFVNSPNQGLNENYGRELLELHTLGSTADIRRPT